MLWKNVQHSWRGGQFDKSLMGRTDLEKYAEAASTLENFLVKKTGCISKRRGTELVCDLENLLGYGVDGKTREIDKIRIVPVERDDDGRYVLFTDNRVYIAKRDGILLCDGTYSRKIKPYAACDPDGTRKVYSGGDNLANSEKPICIRRLSAATGCYQYFWYADMRSAYAALNNGDTLQLHADYVLDSTTKVTNAPVVSYTLDLYGYTLAVMGQSMKGIEHATMSNEHVAIKITSSRTGGRVELSSWGNTYLLQIYSSTASASADIEIDAVEVVNYICNTNACGLIAALTTGTVTVNSGVFRNVRAYSDAESVFTPLMIHCRGDLVINGGTFIANVANYNSGGMFSLPSGKVLTINGGYFEMNVPEGSSEKDLVGVICNTGSYQINGGYFNVPRGRMLGDGGGGYWPGVREIHRINITTDVLGTYADGRPLKRLSDFVNGSTVNNDVYQREGGVFGLKTAGEADYVCQRGSSSDTRPYAYSVPYADSDLAALSIAQVGDTLFIAHRNYPPAKLTTDNRGYPTWTEIRFDKNKWKRPSIDSVSMAGNDNSSGASRTIRYCVTYVKDGVESPKSKAKSLTYSLPWSQGAVVRLNFSSGNNSSAPDYFNIYKDNGAGWGLIGCTASDNIFGSEDISVNSGMLWIPLPGTRNSQNGNDYEMDRGLGLSGITPKLVGSGTRYWPSNNDADLCVITSEKCKTYGVEFTFKELTPCTFVRIWLDGRVYDKERDYAYLIPSNPNVKVTLLGTDGNNADKATPYERTVLQYTSPGNHSASHKPSGIAYTEVDGFAGWRNGGSIFADWINLKAESTTLPNGDPLWLLGVGEGQQTEWFNKHRRYIDVQLDLFDKIVNQKWVYDRYENVHVKSIKLEFSTSVYTDWFSNCQGTVRGIEFYNQGDGVGSSSGSFEDDYITPDMSNTPPPEVASPHFSQTGDYPACVGMYGEKGQRLVYASTENNPMGFWMSATGDLYNFTAHESIRESDAIEASIAVTEKPRINHIIVDKYLLVLTDGSEWRVAPVSGNALSFKTICANKESTIGCSRTNVPIAVGREILFVELTGMTVRAIAYSFTAEGYESQDISVLSSDLFKDNPIVQLAYRQYPDSHLECVLQDGSVATLVYMKEHEMVAWSRQVLGGGFKARGIGCDQNVTNGSSDCTMLVERNGKYRLWRLRDYNQSRTAEAQVSMDGLEFGTNPDDFPEDMTVVELGGGRYAAGYPFTARLVTIRPEANVRDTTQYEIHNATEVELRILEGSSFRVGALGLSQEFFREVKIEPVINGETGEIELATQDVRKTLYGSNQRDGRIELIAEGFWPLSILTLSTTYQLEPANSSGEGGKQ